MSTPETLPNITYEISHGALLLNKKNAFCLAPNARLLVSSTNARHTEELGEPAGEHHECARAVENLGGCRYAPRDSSTAGQL